MLAYIPNPTADGPFFFSRGFEQSTSTAREETTPNPDRKTKNTKRSREEVASDLKEWQMRFAAAASNGAKDLGERVGSIVDSYVAEGALGHGANLAVKLEDVVGDQLSAVKSRINESVASLPAEDSPSEEIQAQEKVNKSIKEAATAIRDQTHALRQWRGSFDDELSARVSAAIDSSLHILDSIRDLGFQELGMRWASTDGITYEDWAKYHFIKSELDDWKSGVKEAATHHEKLGEAKTSAKEILDHGMVVAEAAAIELPRLRDAGQWKIAAHEVSDNFETRNEPPPARAKPHEKADEEASESSEGAFESSASDTATPEVAPETESSTESLPVEKVTSAPSSTTETTSGEPSYTSSEEVIWEGATE